MSPRALTAIAVFGGFALLSAGCQSGEQAAEGEAQMQETGQAVSLPDTTAASVWSYLQQVSYQTAWSTWPGKGKLYAGTEPHGMLLTTYLSPVALDALTNKAGAMPAGAIIVKENYAPDSTYAAATVMYKVSGYDPQNNDWFWMKRNADGTVEAQGRVPMCAGCHAQAKDNDYVVTGSIR